MMTQVENTPDGYVVSAYLDDGRGYGRWTPLRNFGDRQGDAMEFCHIDCPKLDEREIRLLAKTYNQERIFMRIHHGKSERASIIRVR